MKLGRIWVLILVTATICFIASFLTLNRSLWVKEKSTPAAVISAGEKSESEMVSRLESQLPKPVEQKVTLLGVAGWSIIGIGFVTVILVAVLYRPYRKRRNKMYLSGGRVERSRYSKVKKSRKVGTGYAIRSNAYKKYGRNIERRR